MNHISTIPAANATPWNLLVLIHFFWEYVVHLRVLWLFASGEPPLHRKHWICEFEYLERFLSRNSFLRCVLLGQAGPWCCKWKRAMRRRTLPSYQHEVGADQNRLDIKIVSSSATHLFQRHTYINDVIKLGLTCRARGWYGTRRR